MGERQCVTTHSSATVVPIEEDTPPDHPGGPDRAGQASAFSPSQIEAARDALRCPQLAELLDSVRAPLTFDRFMTNLTGSFTRDGIRFDRDPVQARKCGSTVTP